MIKTLLERLSRAALATVVSQLIPLLPAGLNLIPTPWNLVAIPVLMGIAKGLRDGFPGKPWLKYVPF